MLFWLFVIVFVIGIGLLIIGRTDYKILYNYSDGIILAGFLTSVISAIAVFSMICIIASTHIGKDAVVMQYRETYKALTYKVESGACRDDFGLLNKEVIDEIQNWNEDIVFHKKSKVIHGSVSFIQIFMMNSK